MSTRDKVFFLVSVGQPEPAWLDFTLHTYPPSTEVRFDQLKLDERFLTLLENAHLLGTVSGLRPQ